jgi:REP element-mobilizing transposase RayT
LFRGVGAKVSAFLTGYAESKGIYMKINYVNPEHVHALIDLPTRYSMEEVFKLLKGSSSHWINDNRLVRSKFASARGYGAFSVSQSGLEQVAHYIATQEEHHRSKSFQEEYAALIKRYGCSGGARKPLKRLRTLRHPCDPLDESRG